MEKIRACYHIAIFSQEVFLPLGIRHGRSGHNAFGCVPELAKPSLQFQYRRSQDERMQIAGQVLCKRVVICNANGWSSRVQFPTCHLSVESDPRLLEQMLRNLLSNALEYTHEGRILLGCRRHGGWLSIEVWDTGIGMEPSEQELILEDYAPIQNFSLGNGTGLLIVKRLCTVLGHRLRVQSSFTKGSAFSIDVALSRESAALSVAAQENDLQQQAPVTNSEMILIVEDDVELLELLGALLKSEGYQVAMAIDAVTALESVKHRGVQPDLILADFNLPGSINGLQLIGQLRKKLHRSIPAIILTGDISRQTSRDVAFEHCNQLNKPAKLKEVIFCYYFLACTTTPGDC